MICHRITGLLFSWAVSKPVKLRLRTQVSPVLFVCILFGFFVSAAISAVKPKSRERVWCLWCCSEEGHLEKSVKASLLTTYKIPVFAWLVIWIERGVSLSQCVFCFFFSLWRSFSASSQLIAVSTEQRHRNRLIVFCHWQLFNIWKIHFLANN